MSEHDASPEEQRAHFLDRMRAAANTSRRERHQRDRFVSLEEMRRASTHRGTLIRAARARVEAARRIVSARQRITDVQVIAFHHMEIQEPARSLLPTLQIRVETLDGFHQRWRVLTRDEISSLIPPMLARAITREAIGHTLHAAEVALSPIVRERLYNAVTDPRPNNDREPTLRHLYDAFSHWYEDPLPRKPEPQVPLLQQKLKEDHGECSICQEELVKGTIVHEIPCVHRFHLECLDGWLKRKQMTCPNCRSNLSC